MRVEVCSEVGSGEHLGYCTIPDSVWEPAWRTGWLHLFGPPDTPPLRAILPPRDISPTEERHRHTFRVTTRHIDGGPPHHAIQISDVANVDLLPDYIANMVEVPGHLLSGGPELPTMPGGSSLRHRSNDEMRFDAERRARATPESNILAENPLFRVTSYNHGIQAGDRVEIMNPHGRQVHDSVVVEINQHTLTLEVATELDLNTDQHAEIARRIADRIDEEILHGLRSMWINGEKVWDRDTRDIATPMATTTAGKRAIEL